MENFIVRIYRRENADPNRVTGVVEDPDSSESKRFSNIEDLISILVPQAINTKNKKKKQVVEHRKHRRFSVREGTPLRCQKRQQPHLISAFFLVRMNIIPARSNVKD
jgi:hypothetical protein